MTEWQIKHGQSTSVPQKTVTNMSTKDNPGTLPINLYLTEQPTSQPFDWIRLYKIGEVQGENRSYPKGRGRRGKVKRSRPVV